MSVYIITYLPVSVSEILCLRQDGGALSLRREREAGPLWRLPSRGWHRTLGRAGERDNHECRLRPSPSGVDVSI